MGSKYNTLFFNPPQLTTIAKDRLLPSILVHTLSQPEKALSHEKDMETLRPEHKRNFEKSWMDVSTK